MSKQYTQEEVLTNFNAALNSIKSGVLRTLPEDAAFIERSLTSYMLANKLEPSKENFSKALSALAASLPWAVKPAALLAQEQNEQQRNQNNAKADANAFAAKVKAGEQADAKKKADAETFKSIESAIAGYTPIDPRGRIAYGKQSEQQARLRRYVAQEVARNASASSIAEQVRKEIARLYAVAEKESERV